MTYDCITAMDSGIVSKEQILSNIEHFENRQRLEREAGMTIGSDYYRRALASARDALARINA